MFPCILKSNRVFHLDMFRFHRGAVHADEPFPKKSSQDSNFYPVQQQGLTAENRFNDETRRALTLWPWSAAG